MGLLTTLIITPLIGALVIAIFARNCESGASSARWVALLTTLITLALSLLALSEFSTKDAEFQLVENISWFNGYNISYHVGVDGISLAMILLTTFLMPFCILCSWESITKRVSEFMIAFLVLEALVIGVFAALDLLLFYVFFEAVLIPMYIIIGVWGGDKRIYAAYKFFLYTLAGSVLFLIAVLYLYYSFGTTDITVLLQEAGQLKLSEQKWLWLALFASFAIKVPMWPFHTWLPDAHVQAPTAGSVILAGILLKMGAYGFLRFSLPMLPDASAYFADFIFTLSILAVVVTSLVALVQKDMKKLIAYSSVAHMGFVTLGIFSFTQQGIEGAIFQMISHGVISGALFLCVGVLYDRMHTKEIAAYGGVANVMPQFAFIFMIFTMGSVGLPATAGFVGEILVLVGTFQVSQWAAMGAATGLILGAAYMLWLYRRVMFGVVANHEVEQLRDVSAREWLLFAPLILAVLWLGIYPKPVLKLIEPATLQLLAYNQTREAPVAINSKTKASTIARSKGDEGKDHSTNDQETQDNGENAAQNQVGNNADNSQNNSVLHSISHDEVNVDSTVKNTKVESKE